MGRWIDSLKDNAKLAALHAPKGMLRPMAELLWRLGLSRRNYYIYSKLGFPDTVLAGPFNGMKYLPCSVGSSILPKYLGTYEKELWGAIEDICREPRDVVLDVGSAEGFYAVGLTMRLHPQSTHCFDIDHRANRLLDKIASLNHVREHMHIHEGCTVSELESALSGATRPLVKMDVEGFEDELLDPVRVPSLKKAVIVVEVHEALRFGVGKRIEQRFCETHIIEKLGCARRSVADIPPGVAISPDDSEFAMDETRTTEVGWFVMQPKSPNGAPAVA